MPTACRSAAAWHESVQHPSVLPSCHFGFLRSEPALSWSTQPKQGWRIPLPRSRPNRADSRELPGIKGAITVSLRCAGWRRHHQGGSATNLEAVDQHLCQNQSDRSLHRRRRQARPLPCRYLAAFTPMGWARCGRRRMHRSAAGCRTTRLSRGAHVTSLREAPAQPLDTDPAECVIYNLINRIHCWTAAV